MVITDDSNSRHIRFVGTKQIAAMASKSHDVDRDYGVRYLNYKGKAINAFPFLILVEYACLFIAFGQVAQVCENFVYVAHNAVFVALVV